jgi:hypothetical protein
VPDAREFFVDVHKAGAWANIGSFVIALLLIVRSQQPTNANGFTMTPGLGIFVAGLVLAGCLNFAAVWMTYRSSSKKQTPAAANSDFPSSDLPKAFVQIQDPSPAPAKLDDGSAPPPVIQVEDRTFVRENITPEYLVGLFEGHTSIQAKRLVEPFIGNWMMISGRLGEVLSTDPDGAQVTFSERRLSELAAVLMYFQGKKWVDRLSILKREDSIAVVGQITQINSVWVQLDNCELAD